MATVKINGARLGAVFRADARRVPAAIRAGLREGAERGRTFVKTKTPSDLGTMRNAWMVKEQPYGASLDNSAPYAGIIEGGARPHSISEEGIAAIREWVIRNVAIVEVKRGARAGTLRRLSSRQRQLARSDPESQYAKAVDRVVKAIAWKLRIKGQQGKFIVRDNLERLARWANQAAREAVKRALEKPEG